MKLPRVDLQSLGDVLIRHGEKFVVGVVGIVGALFLWWGIDAVRSLSVGETLAPEAVGRAVDQARKHIDQVPETPADLLPPRTPLAETLDPWRKPLVPWIAGSAEGLVIAEPPTLANLDNPLFQEFAKRGTPKVLPIEDVRAVAGIAVLPAPPPRQAPAGGGPPVAPGRQKRPDPAAGRRPPGRGAELPAEVPDMLQPAGPAGQAVRIVPYVIVTGLIPVASQAAEFESVFAGTGFRKADTDKPRWDAYRVERQQVVPGGGGRWENMDAAKVVGVPGGGPGMEQGPVPAQAADVPMLFQLSADQGALSYVAPLPLRLDEPWGIAAIHPWFLPMLRKMVADGLATPEGLPVDGGAEAPPAESVSLGDLKAAPVKYVGQRVAVTGVRLDGAPQRAPDVPLVTFAVSTTDGSVATPGTAPGVGTDLTFATSEQFAAQLTLLNEELRRPCKLLVRIDLVGRTPVARVLTLDSLDEAGVVVDSHVEPAPQPVAGTGGMPGEPMPAANEPEFRLFRFVDTTVRSGQQYRYRVKFALRNPNAGIPGQYLVDPAFAKDQYLLSKESAETAPVLVPEPTSLLVRTLPKTDVKRFKPNAIEVLVLAPSKATETFTLRSVLTEPGGLANVDARLNKPGDPRTRGEDFQTNRVLLDVRGRQEDRADQSRVTGPPEVLEVLFLRSDGSCEVVSAADSQLLYDRYADTLPGEDERKGQPTDLPEMPPDPLGAPLPRGLQ